MALITHQTSEPQDGVVTRTTIFEPTGVKIWEIPQKGDKTHGTLISRDPISGEETSRITVENGTRVGEGWFKPGAVHTGIVGGGEDIQAWVWADPKNDALLRAKTTEFVSKENEVSRNQHLAKASAAAVGATAPKP